MRLPITNLLAGLIIGLVFSSVHAIPLNSTAQALQVDYDKNADLLSVDAEKVSLKLVLDRIAGDSGIELLFDDLADKSISSQIQSKPLEKALKQLLIGGNYLLRYGKDKQGKPLLIGLMVLPVGDDNRKSAGRTQALTEEAYHRTRSELSLDKVQQIDTVTERWQARLSEMPIKSQEKLMKNVKAQILASVKRDQRRAERAKKRYQKADKGQAGSQLDREKALESYTPEQRASLEKQRIEAHERMRLLLQNQN